LRVVLAAALVIPLGLDLYMPVPEENPLAVDNIELGRRLFNERRSLAHRSTGAILTITETAHTRHEPGTRRI
jgi:hypothetical protein